MGGNSTATAFGIIKGAVTELIEAQITLACKEPASVENFSSQLSSLAFALL